MKLKENTTQRKLRGGYYTPQKLADYITKITLTFPSVEWNLQRSKFLDSMTVKSERMCIERISF